MNIVKVESLSYSIHTKTILDDISFSVNDREALALIGENGSGKTTLIDSILGDIKPSKGVVKLFGTDKFNFDNIGVVYDKSPMFPMLTISETIKYFCYLNKVDYKSFLKKGYIETFQLEKIACSYIAHLSQGEKQRLGVMISLIRNPRLLILDEPFSNLDPIIISHIWEVIKIEERTVLFSTHNWKEVEKLASKIVLIKKGKMICEPSSPKDLLSKLPAKKKLVVRISEQLKERYNGYASYQEGENLILFFNGDEQFMDDLSKYSTNYSIQDVSLKDVYLYSLTK